MNRIQTLAALCVASATCAGTAMAQSSVTLQGYVDASARATHNSIGTLKSLSSGNNSTSRIVLRGTEDLGDGLSAGFWLESSIYTDTGTSGALTVAPTSQFWDRTSIVKLSSTKWGEVRLGREWTPVFTGWVYSDPFIAVGVGSAANFFSSSVSTVMNRAFGSAAFPSTISRSNNAIQYWLPPGLGGVVGQLMAAAGEGSNAQGNFRYVSGRVGWRDDKFDTSVYYGATRIDATSTDFKQTGAYAAYNFGFMRLAGSVTESKYLSSKQLNYILGLSVPMGQHLIRASYNRADQKGTDATGTSIDANDADMVAIGYQYSLSRRTALYTQYAHVSNKGVARFAVPGGPAGVIDAGSGSSGFDVGLRHSF